MGVDPFGTKMHSLLLSISTFLDPKANSSLAPQISLPQRGLSFQTTLASAALTSVFLCVTMCSLQRPQMLEAGYLLVTSFSCEL